MICICAYTQMESSVSSESDDDFSEECFHCGERIPVPFLRGHVRQCSLRYK